METTRKSVSVDDLPRQALTPKFQRLLDLMKAPDRSFVMNYHTGNIKCTRNNKVGSSCDDVSYMHEGQRITQQAAHFRLTRPETQELWPLYVQYAQWDHQARNRVAQAQNLLGRARMDYGELPPGIQSGEDLYSMPDIQGLQAENILSLLSAKERADGLFKDGKVAADASNMYKKPGDMSPMNPYRRAHYEKIPLGYLEAFANARRAKRETDRLMRSERAEVAKEIAKEKARREARAAMGEPDVSTDVEMAPVIEKPAGKKRGRPAGQGKKEKPATVAG